MTEAAIAYYITGHGYGHARRSAEVIRNLLEIWPGLTVHIRTTAPPFIFASLPAPRITLEDVELDPGAIEDDALTINPDQTVRRLRAAMATAGERLEREAQFLQGWGIGGILADIPFLAGELVRRVGIPGMALANFTWDWIYAPWLSETVDGRELLSRIADGYRRLGTLLRMPFGGISDVFDEVVDTPLVASPSRLSREQVLDCLPEKMRDPRPRVLVAMRGGTSPALIERAAASMPEVLLVAANGRFTAENIVNIEPDTTLAFEDIASVCDAVISKLGYGIIADCAAMGVGIVWPPRLGFREDSAAAPWAEPHVRLSRMEVEDYRSGNWAPAVRRVLEMPRPAKQMEPTGGRWCAEFIKGWWRA